MGERVVFDDADDDDEEDKSHSDAAARKLKRSKDKKSKTSSSKESIVVGLKKKSKDSKKSKDKSKSKKEKHSKEIAAQNSSAAPPHSKHLKSSNKKSKAEDVTGSGGKKRKRSDDCTQVEGSRRSPRLAAAASPMLSAKRCGIFFAMLPVYLICRARSINFPSFWACRVLNVTLLQRALASAFGFSISSLRSQAKEEEQGRQKRGRRTENVKREQKEAQFSMCCREERRWQRFGQKETQEIQMKNFP